MNRCALRSVSRSGGVRGAWLVAATVLGFYGSLSFAADRVALVVGCSRYKNDIQTLKTPEKDANDLTALLKKLDFTVISLVDATKGKFDTSLSEFTLQAQGAKVAMIYFSGHGIEHDGRDYLITVDAALESADKLETQTVKLERVMTALNSTGATAKLAVLDCCRDNPFPALQTKSIRSDVLRELGKAEDPQATFVFFATSAGRTAAAVLDENSRNSPFTQFFLKELATPGRTLRDIFENVHDQLKAATDGGQEPVLQMDNALSEIFRQTVLLPAGAQGLQIPNFIPLHPDDLPQKGYFDLDTIFGGSACRQFNAYSRKRILKQVQTKLMECKIYFGEPDGAVGPKTQDAVLDWQRRQHLPATGRLDDPTLRSLQIDNPTEYKPEPESQLPPQQKQSPVAPSAAPPPQYQTPSVPARTQRMRGGV